MTGDIEFRQPSTWLYFMDYLYVHGYSDILVTSASNKATRFIVT